MGPHDVAGINGTIVTCACGATFAALGLDKAKAKHEAHFQIQRARAALRGVEVAAPDES
jgi:hypothetical protein